MIRICKDNDIQVVTKGAYETLYKPLGYKPVIEVKAKEVKVQLEDKAVRNQKRTRGSSNKVNVEE